MSSSYFFEDLRVGQTAMLSKTITEADILMYSVVSMDTLIRSISTRRRRVARGSVAVSRTECCRPA